MYNVYEVFMRITGTENNDTVLKEIGARIHRQRVVSNLKQSELAEKAGISIATMTRIERGEPTTIENLIRIMRALGILQNIDLMFPEQHARPDELHLYGHERKRVTDRKKEHEKIKEREIRMMRSRSR